MRRGLLPLLGLLAAGGQMTFTVPALGQFSVDIEPKSENTSGPQVVHYLHVAPKTTSDPPQGRVCLRLSINNSGTNALQLSMVTIAVGTHQNAIPISSTSFTVLRSLCLQSRRVALVFGRTKVRLPPRLDQRHSTAVIAFCSLCLHRTAARSRFPSAGSRHRRLPSLSRRTMVLITPFPEKPASARTVNSGKQIPSYTRQEQRGASSSPMTWAWSASIPKR